MRITYDCGGFLTHVSSIRPGSGTHGHWTEVKEQVDYPEEGIGKGGRNVGRKDEFPIEKDEEFPREYCFCTTCILNPAVKPFGSIVHLTLMTIN